MDSLLNHRYCAPLFWRRHCHRPIRSYGARFGNHLRVEISIIPCRLHAIMDLDSWDRLQRSARRQVPKKAFACFKGALYGPVRSKGGFHRSASSVKSGGFTIPESRRSYRCMVLQPHLRLSALVFTTALGSAVVIDRIGFPYSSHEHINRWKYLGALADGYKL